jgi:hypothetical protein
LTDVRGGGTTSSRTFPTQQERNDHMRIRAKAFGSLAMLGVTALVVAGCTAGNTAAPSDAATDAAELPSTDWVRADASGCRTVAV